MRKLFDEWGIAAIGALLISAILYAASPAPESVQTLQTKGDHEASQMTASSANAAPALPAQVAVAPAGPPVASQATGAAPSSQPHAIQPATPMPAMAHDMKMVAADTPHAVLAAAPPLPIPGGDPAAGRLVFRKCQVCHSLEPGKDILGPSLAGIVGRKSGAEPGYSYSPAMSHANLVWDAKTLDAYLSDPQKVVAGNKMPFPGLKTNQD